MLLVESVEHVLLPLERASIAESLDAEVLRPGGVFGVDAADTRDVSSFTWWDITGVRQWRFNPRVSSFETSECPPRHPSNVEGIAVVPRDEPLSDSRWIEHSVFD